MTLNRLIVLEYLVGLTLLVFLIIWWWKEKNWRKVVYKILAGIWGIFVIYIAYGLIVQIPLYSAISKHDYEKAKKLLSEHSRLIRSRQLLGDTVLHEAVKSQNEDVVRLLIEKDADVNAAEFSRITPLHLAADNGHVVIVELLLERGADVNARGYRYNQTALHVAARRGDLPVAKLLVRYGADISVRNWRGERALEVARKKEQTSLVRYLEDMAGKPTDQPGKPTGNQKSPGSDLNS